MTRRSRRLRRVVVTTAVGVVVVAASITVALLVTPAQRVSAAGQTVDVGAAAPTLSTSGPGELDLFGQRLPTHVQFVGPVRPRLVLSEIALNREVASFLQPGRRGQAVTELGTALAAGWRRYVLWESVIAGATAVLLVGAVAGWLRFGWRRSVLVVVCGLVAVEAVNLGAVMVAAYTAPSRLSHVGSLEALVGRTPLAPVPAAPGPSEAQYHAVVLGDSTASGLGLAPLPSPTRLDSACHRSSESYAADLAEANGWRVQNLACSGATVRTGLLGPQPLGSVTAPPQLAVAKQASAASVVIVSVGADDLRWSAILRLCAATKTCDNRAVTAYFQQRLAGFATAYYGLLRQLAALPNRPHVLVNLYYDPFDTSKHCLDSVGLTPAKERTLGSLLDALNGILAKGAQASSFTPVRPSFAGHAICDAHPYVQGLHDPAPFHPTAAGQLAIALADEHALQTHTAP